ncbi:hypothetical protein C1Y18_25710 [Pseudomonas sp. MPR-R5A]|nr:hypothetical protein C1Y20_25445 [Pseudomonas sp. FW301-21B01]PMY03550.1 hypothetical protein C1Y18_25710 [Pseudomonas sp. MPR-R5A]PMY06800.1 hypothetical protein C1Y22_28630 [Pseudomonas sp. MPR-R2A5]PNA61918.1 hypothetical protein C1Y14_28565 [Pseudomonas sp. MPR-R5B]RTY77180.1 hypothetical protein EKA83_13145 [Pseudomonas veronii]
MADCWFFYDAGICDLDGLIAVAYDLAYFWKTDPELVMARSLDIVLESIAHAQRINNVLEGG